MQMKLKQQRNCFSLPSFLLISASSWLVADVSHPLFFLLLSHLHTPPSSFFLPLSLRSWRWQFLRVSRGNHTGVHSPLTLVISAVPPYNLFNFSNKKDMMECVCVCRQASYTCVCMCNRSMLQWCGCENWQSSTGSPDVNQNHGSVLYTFTTVALPCPVVYVTDMKTFCTSFFTFFIAFLNIMGLSTQLLCRVFTQNCCMLQLLKFLKKDCGTPSNIVQKKNCW